MGVAFRHTVEMLRERVIDRHHLFKRDELVALKAEPPRDLNLEQWMALLHETARRLAPERAEEARLELLGREVLRGYRDTLVGRSLLFVARLAGPRGILLRIADSYRTADSFTVVRAEQVAPCEVHLVFNTDFGVPTYIRGILSEALVVLGQHQHSVTFVPEPAGGTRFIAKW